jgi:hypothetical protein
MSRVCGGQGNTAFTVSLPEFSFDCEVTIHSKPDMLDVGAEPSGFHRDRRGWLCTQNSDSGVGEFFCDLILAHARTQIVDDTDSQIDCVLFVTEP